jgi:hypothetical protein
MSSTEDFSTATYAIVSENADLDLDGMNADGSRGVAAELSIGGELDRVFGSAWDCWSAQGCWRPPRP